MDKLTPPGVRWEPPQRVAKPAVDITATAGPNANMRPGAVASKPSFGYGKSAVANPQAAAESLWPTTGTTTLASANAKLAPPKMLVAIRPQVLQAAALTGQQKYQNGISEGYCPDFNKPAGCPRGATCVYRHPTMQCRHFQRGHCSRNENCSFIHDKNTQVNAPPPITHVLLTHVYPRVPACCLPLFFFFRFWVVFYTFFWGWGGYLRYTKPWHDK